MAYVEPMEPRQAFALGILALETQSAVVDCNEIRCGYQAAAAVLRQRLVAERRKERRKGVSGAQKNN